MLPFGPFPCNFSVIFFGLHIIILPKLCIIFLPKLCIVWQVGADLANSTASASRSRSRIELRELKRRDYDYAKVTGIMHVHNHYAKFRQNDYAKFRQTVVPLHRITDGIAWLLPTRRVHNSRISSLATPTFGPCARRGPPCFRPSLRMQSSAAPSSITYG
jgi:hypothetical protein